MTGTAYLKQLMARAGQNVKTIVLPEGEDERILKAAHIIAENKAANVIILGDKSEIERYFSENGMNFEKIEIIKPEESPRLNEYAAMFYELRKDKGITMEDAQKQLLDYNYFSTMMIKAGHADGMVSGANHSTADTVRPALQIIKSKQKGRSVSSSLIMVINEEPYAMADCGLIIDPTVQELADLAIDTAETAMMMGIEPRVAMLSYSTRGSGKGPSVDKVREATVLAKEELKKPQYQDWGIKLDGEMQADAALDDVVAKKKAPDSEIAGKANVLVFPNLDTGNIAYKLLQRTLGAEAYGPIMQGLNAPVNDLSRGALVEDIVGMITITCLQAVKK